MATNIATAQSTNDMSEITDKINAEGEATQFLTFILDNEAYGVEIGRAHV